MSSSLKWELLIILSSFIPSLTFCPLLSSPLLSCPPLPSRPLSLSLSLFSSFPSLSCRGEESRTPSHHHNSVKKSSLTSGYIRGSLAWAVLPILSPHLPKGLVAWRGDCRSKGLRGGPAEVGAKGVLGKLCWSRPPTQGTLQSSDLGRTTPTPNWPKIN